MYGFPLGGWTTGVALASIFISYSRGRVPIPLNWLRYLLSISVWGFPSPSHVHPRINSLFTKLSLWQPSTPQLVWHLPQPPEPPPHGIDLSTKQSRQSLFHALNKRPFLMYCCHCPLYQLHYRYFLALHYTALQCQTNKSWNSSNSFCKETVNFYPFRNGSIGTYHGPEPISWARCLPVVTAESG